MWPQILDGTLREGMKSLSDIQGGCTAGASNTGLSNMIMQMRKVNPVDGSPVFLEPRCHVHA